MEKTIDQKLAIVRAHLEGKEIEYCGPNNRWEFIKHPAWQWDAFDYRVKPEPPKPAYIDWSHVGKVYNYLFYGHYGSWRLSDRSPDIISKEMVENKKYASAFRVFAAKTVLADSFTSFVPGDPSIIITRPSHASIPRL